MMSEVPLRTIAKVVTFYQDHRLEPAFPMAVGLVQNQLVIVSDLQILMQKIKYKKNIIQIPWYVPILTILAMVQSQ